MRDVTDGHVRGQDNRLAVVVQAGGGTLGPCGEAECELANQPQSPNAQGCSPLVWALQLPGHQWTGLPTLRAVGERELPSRAAPGLPDCSLISSPADTHCHLHRPQAQFCLVPTLLEDLSKIPHIQGKVQPPSPAFMVLSPTNHIHGLISH